MKKLISILLLSLSCSAFGSDYISKQLQKEFSHLYAVVEHLQPEFQVGGLLNGKKYGDYELLWRLADEPGEYDIIRIFHDHQEPYKSFDISFYRADHIVRGRKVIRRFVGPSISGWRNDTIDAETGEYLGSQGASTPRLTARDRQIMSEWGIELFE